MLRTCKDISGLYFISTERWKMRILRLLCDSQQPDFQKKLQEQLSGAKKKQKHIEEILKALHFDIKHLTNECASLAQTRLYEVTLL